MTETITLHRSDLANLPEALSSAYAELPVGGSIVISGFGLGDLTPVLFYLERAGFCGMRFPRAEIRAVKGKEGPCFETGRTARYRGSAAAVMDDDHHLLFGELRVCEKTARLYSSEAYRDLIDVSAPVPALIARLERDPVPFDCDTFDSDSRKLAASMTDGGATPPGRTVVLYPGPFKLLILRDGTMVPRGRRVAVPAALATDLATRDGAILFGGEPGVDASNFLTLFKARGPACLLDDLAAGAPAGKGVARDLRALDQITPDMKRRLAALLDRGDEYFVLTGSDPAQKDGCCPSNDVGEANRLVGAGILEAWGAAANSDCPTNIYALAGEILRDGPRPTFSRNEPFRAEVRARLETTGFGKRALLRAALLAVIAAALVTLALAAFRQLGGR